MSLQKICRLDDILDGHARGFDVLVDKETISIICVRQAQQIFAYKNNCPHTGINLKWVAYQFIDDSGQYLVCSTHGALFQIEDGYCIAGPCAGDALQEIVVKLEHGNIFIDAIAVEAN